MQADLFLLPDSNLFIQCKPLKDLDWSPWKNYSHVRLIVTRPVQVEIDRQKNKGSDRLGQRARKASSLFREMLKAEHNDMVIREADPRVTMMLAINMRPDPQLENSLDYSERDDQLVGIASAYSKNFPDTEVSVLTYDTGPMLSAKNVGVKWTDFPQSWLLEPETSETEKTIRKLQTQLEQARNAGPVLDLRCTDKAGEPVKRLDVSVTRYTPLTHYEIEKLLSLVKQRRPMATDFGPRDAAERNTGGNNLLAIFGDQEVFTPATDAEIRQYKNADYPGWLASIETFLQGMHTIARQINEPPLLIFEAENNGTKPAQDTLVVIKAKGAILVMPPPNDDPEETDIRRISPRTYFKDGLKLRAPPEPPTGKWTKRNHYLNDLIAGPGLHDYSRYLRAMDTTAFQRDPNDFYYKSDRPEQPTDFYSLECEQWRHSSGQEIFEVEISAEREALLSSGVVEIAVHAENLHEVKVMQIPVKLTVQQEPLFDRALALVNAC
ncbi:MAG TPA: hypothetical protein DEQ45_05045 [Agrobacterium sp.]|uniref:PIN domain-containing protein n=1 Tax=Rhizobium sp. TaxID=391 RepID=UPI000ED57749|nr:hypothetical protein [Agrobacterium sp.]